MLNSLIQIGFWLLIPLLNILQAQESAIFFTSNDFIKTWQIDKIDKEKVDIINNLRNDDRMKSLFKFYSTKKEFLDCFDIIDFNQDGIDDIYYKGYSGAEGNSVIFFEGKGNGKFEKTLDVFGQLIACTKKEQNSNFIITVFDYPCCAGYINFIEKYVFKQDSLKSNLLLIRREAYIDDMVFPKDFFKQPITFKTKNEKYKLRYEPIIKDDEKDKRIYIIGNILAEYPKDSKGVALAEETDSTGRKWWFVMMYNNKNPINTVFYHGNNNESTYFCYGWMSSNFLEIIK